MAVATLGRMAPSRLLAPLLFAFSLATGAALASGGTGAPAPAPRPLAPTSAAIEVPLATAIGPAAARRAPSPAAARNGGVAGSPVTGSDRLFPETRVVTVYGAPQLSATIVGKRSPSGSASEAVRLSTRYAEIDPRPARPGIDLIATVATADKGPSGLYRSRQSPGLIAAYLDAARAVGGRLVLDIQPGRAKFIREVRAYEEWLVEPDVDIALDPEWNVGRRGIPGVTEGKVTAKQLNKVSSYLAGIVTDNDLSQKGLYVHQFREGSVRGREDVAQRGAKVAVTLSFDGIGSPAPKIAGYQNLSQPGLFNGFSVFVSLDTDVMGFRQVAELDPVADYVMYQ
ncbi:MAG: hypothetical protein ACR2OC_13525 [Solirubrobacterales bacterium]